jgi:hypothetical protein
MYIVVYIICHVLFGAGIGLLGAYVSNRLDKVEIDVGELSFAMLMGAVCGPFSIPVGLILLGIRYLDQRSSKVVFSVRESNKRMKDA